MLRQKVEQAVRETAWRFPFHMLAKEKQIRVYPGSGARVFKIKIESCKKIFMVNTKSIIKKLITACVAAMGVSGGYAQNGSGYFNQAENLFKARNYYEA